VKPQVFSLKPIGEYGHRLVLDLYPLVPIDPLMALLEKSGEQHTEHRPETPPKNVEKPAEVSRLLTVVLDPGHGGEDPGAVGRGGSYEKNVTLEVARRLKAKIDELPNMRTVLTRDGDFYSVVQMRVQPIYSTPVHASIHQTARLVGIRLVRKQASSSAARWLATKESTGANLSVGSSPRAHLARPLANRHHQRQPKLATPWRNRRINTLPKAAEQTGFAVLKLQTFRPSSSRRHSSQARKKRLNDDAYQINLKRS
jgi:N-acetylmuramoyl-L-alanine amidase